MHADDIKTNQYYSIIAKSGKKGKKDTKKEEEEHVTKPTRALSSYIFYSSAIIPKLKQDEGISHKDAMAKAGMLWNKLSDEEKKVYNKMHDEDVLR